MVAASPCGSDIVTGRSRHEPVGILYDRRRAGSGLQANAGPLRFGKSLHKRVLRVSSGILNLAVQGWGVSGIRKLDVAIGPVFFNSPHLRSG